ncbi:MAG: hypothetical protein AAFU03_09325, partial [Bacteroidota bacterium]
MQQLKEAKHEIQVLISTNQRPEAIKALKALLPEENPKHKEIILLEGRLNEINLRRIRGLASNEELRLTYNNLRNDLVELVQQIQEADLDTNAVSNLSESGTAKTGHVLYQIPSTMRLQQETKCVVRIALSDAQIIKSETRISLKRGSSVRVISLIIC